MPRRTPGQSGLAGAAGIRTRAPAAVLLGPESKTPLGGAQSAPPATSRVALTLRNPPRRVSVALTVRRNISLCSSNIDEKLGAHGSQRNIGFIGVSWDQGCGVLVRLALGWQFVLGSSPRLPANPSLRASAATSPFGLVRSGAPLPRREAPPRIRSETPCAANQAFALRAPITRLGPRRRFFQCARNQHIHRLDLKLLSSALLSSGGISLQQVQ
jgi:hypothetical protein